MNLFELFIKIGVDDQASSQISKIAKGLGNGLKTAAAVGTAAVGAAASGIVALTKSAVENYAEYEQLVGGVETLFGTSADKVQEYASNAYKTAGLSANDYMNTVTSFSASLLQSLGGDTDAAAKKADVAITDMADNANKMGTSIEMLQTTYAGFAKQNFTMLDNLKLGYGGTKEEMQRLLDDASKISGIKYDISSFADITDAIHVMQEEMGIAGATAQEAGMTIEGSVNAMKSAWSNLITGIADENADIGTLINNLVTSIVGDGTDENLGVLGNVLPAVERALEGAGKLIEGVLPVIIGKVPTIINDWLPKILNSGIGIIRSILDGMVKNQGDIASGVVATINTLVNGITDNLPEILVTGVMLIGQIAAGLIQGLPDLIYRIPEIVAEIWDAFADNSDVFLEIGKSIVVGIWNGIVALWNTLVDSFSGLVSGLFGGLNTMTANVNVNGYHANGLSYVPFDGYIAALHKGERVLTASEAREYNNGNSKNNTSGITIIQNIQSVPQTPVEFAAATEAYFEQARWAI